MESQLFSVLMLAVNLHSFVWLMTGSNKANLLESLMIPLAIKTLRATEPIFDNSFSCFRSYWCLFSKPASFLRGLSY